jgi:hypothetical protein
MQDGAFCEINEQGTDGFLISIKKYVTYYQEYIYVFLILLMIFVLFSVLVSTSQNSENYLGLLCKGNKESPPTNLPFPEAYSLQNSDHFCRL